MRSARQRLACEWGEEKVVYWCPNVQMFIPSIVGTPPAPTERRFSGAFFQELF